MKINTVIQMQLSDNAAATLCTVLGYYGLFAKMEDVRSVCPASRNGEVRYGGRLRCEIPDIVFRSSVVSVDQEAMMFEDTVRNNLKMWDGTIEDYAMVLAARDAGYTPTFDCHHHRGTQAFDNP